MTPYEKLCMALVGQVPENIRGRPKAGHKTAKDLARAIGYRHSNLLSWEKIPGTHIRVIPAGVAVRIETASNGAVTADEIREFAKQFKEESGQAVNRQ